MFPLDLGYEVSLEKTPGHPMVKTAYDPTVISLDALPAPWQHVIDQTFLGAHNVRSLERKFRLRCLRTAAARKRGGILGKLKLLVSHNYTISRLPSHPHLVKFGSGAFELQGAHKLFHFGQWPTAPTKPWNVMEWLYLVSVVS